MSFLGGNCLFDLDMFTPGARFLFSTNGKYFATLQSDGRFAVYPGSSPQTTSSDPGVPTGAALWFSGSETPPGNPPADTCWFIFLVNGVMTIFSMGLVVLGPGGVPGAAPMPNPPIWSSNTPQTEGSSVYCILQNDGLLCMYRAPSGTVYSRSNVPPDTMGKVNAIWCSAGLGLPAIQLLALSSQTCYLAALWYTNSLDWSFTEGPPQFAAGDGKIYLATATKVGSSVNIIGIASD